MCLHVREVDAPHGALPIVWRLVTTDPVDTEDQVAAVLGAYLQRWLIEEFFKAIQTGRKYQRLQLESLRALLIALAIEAVVVWRLLLLRGRRTARQWRLRPFSRESTSTCCRASSPPPRLVHMPR